MEMLDRIKAEKDFKWDTETEQVAGVDRAKEFVDDAIAKTREILEGKVRLLWWKSCDGSEEFVDDAIAKTREILEGKVRERVCWWCYCEDEGDFGGEGKWDDKVTFQFLDESSKNWGD
jgi:hypothetical protein